MPVKYMLYENGNVTVCSSHSRFIPDKVNGKKRKSFFIDKAEYRKIASSCVNLWHQRKNNITFFTLTFPFSANEEQANDCFSKFMDNLKLNYGLQNYVATKERGERESRKIHYHCLFDLPFVNIAKLNKAWCQTFRQIGDYSGCAVRLPPRNRGGAVVKSEQRCVKYLAKYVAKSIGVAFDKPCVFISRDVLSKPHEIEQKHLYMLQDSCERTEYVCEYVTTIVLFENKFLKRQATFPKNVIEKTKKNIVTT